VKDNCIKITEAWQKELEMMPFVSKQKGRMSALLKQKSKIGVAVKPRTKYEVLDFDKKIKDNQGKFVVPGSKQISPEEEKWTSLGKKKIVPTILEHGDTDMKSEKK